METKWKICWKTDSTPPLEVYQTYINWFGSNFDIEAFRKFIEKQESHLQMAQEAIAIWTREFSRESEIAEEDDNEKSSS